jgi:phage host-nuclease inhibitor protein Gam
MSRICHVTKPVSVRVPRTLAAALPLLERFASIGATIAAAEAQRAEDLAGINAAADKKIEPQLKELEELRAAIEPWWKKDGAQHLQGKRKTAELGGCTIGSKTGSAKVAHSFDDDDKAVEALRKARLAASFVRTKLSLDRTAIMKFLRGDRAMKLTAIGFSIDQAEQFVLEPIEGAPIGKAA